MTDNKKIYYSNLGIHTYINNLIKNPPKGYEFIVNEEKSKADLLKKLKTNKFVNFVYKKIVKKTVNVFSLIQKTYTNESPNEADLIFSFGVLIHEDKPWVLKVPDSAFSLGGNDPHVFLKNRKKIEKILLSNNCKKIIVHTSDCRKEFEKYFSKEVLNKIELVSPAINFPLGKKVKKTDNTTNFLFMGSINNPREFMLKGGLEALRCFTELKKKHKNIKLIVKCEVPPKIKKKYSDPDITYIDRRLSDDEIKDLYQKTDLLLMPSYGGYFVAAYLECFANGIPVIALDGYGVKSIIEDKKTGLIIKPPKHSPIYSKNYPRNVHDKDFASNFRKDIQIITSDLVREVSKLINDQKLMEKMSENCRKEFQGKFSFERKNKKLKFIFDEALRI